MLAAGVYLLLLLAMPWLNSATLDSSDNSTTQKITETEQIPAAHRLYIPKIDVDVSYESGDASVLERGAWWRVPRSGNPRDGGNFVLAAHRFELGRTPTETLRVSPFYHINRLTIGDEIIIDYQKQRYRYQITDILQVAPNATEIEAPTTHPQLTLYSCTLGGSHDGREVIIAKPAT